MIETLEKTQKENADEIDSLKRRHMSALEVKDKELRTLKGKRHYIGSVPCKVHYY